MKSFSVIIPTYNAEKYIEKCLLSLINQNYEQNKIEILVIDDGSTDNTANIVKQFRKYKNIKYYKKKNGQWGSVINFVKNNNLAHHQYISVLDADDMLAKNAFKIINKQIKDADVFVGSFRKYDGERLRKRVHPYWFLFKRSIKDLKQMNSPFCLPLSYFYKKDLFYKIVDLKEGVAYQDPDLISQIMTKAKLLRFTWKTIGYYFYNRQGNSISQKWDDKRFDAELNACLNCIRNNSPEIVSYRLNLKNFYNLCLEKKIIFNINSKLKFKWYPFYIRPIYVLLHKIKFSKLFRTNA